MHGFMSERKQYPSDLSDERWALIEPVSTAWKATGRDQLCSEQRDLVVEVGV